MAERQRDSDDDSDDSRGRKYKTVENEVPEAEVWT
jgi:hypothetical protein